MIKVDVMVGLCLIVSEIVFSYLTILPYKALRFILFWNNIETELY